MRRHRRYRNGRDRRQEARYARGRSRTPAQWAVLMILAGLVVIASIVR